MSIHGNETTAQQKQHKTPCFRDLKVSKELNIQSYKSIMKKVLSREKLFICLLDEMMDEKLRFNKLELLQINRSIF